MHKLARHFALSSIATTALLLNAGQSALAADGAIHAIVFDPTSHHFKIMTSGHVHALVNTLTVAAQKRVIIDVDNAEIGADLPRDGDLRQQIAAAMPMLRNITVNQYGSASHSVVRILLDIDGNWQGVRLLRSEGPQLEISVDFPLNTPVGNSGFYPAPGSNRPNTGMPPSLQGLQKNGSDSPTAGTGNAATLADLRQSLAAMNQRYAQLQKDNATLKTQLAIAASKSAASSSQPTDVLKASLTKSQTQLTAQQSEMTALKHQLATLQASNAQLKSDRQTTQANAGSMAQTTQQLGALKQQISNLQASNAQLQADSQKAQESAQSATDATQQLGTLQTQIQQLQSSVATQKSQLETATADNQRLQEQLRTQTEKAAQKTAKADNSATMQELNRLRKENAQLRQRPTTATATTPADNTAEINNIRTQLTVAQQSMSDAVQTINEQNRQLAELKSQVADAQNASQPDNSAQLTHLTAQLSQKDGTIKTLQQQLQAKPATGSTATLQKQIALLQSQLTVTKTKLAEATAVKTKASTAAELTAKDQKIAALQTQLNKAQAQQGTGDVSENADLRKQNANLQSQLEIAQAAKSAGGDGTNAQALAAFTAGKAATDGKNLPEALNQFKKAAALAPDNEQFTEEYASALAKNQQYVEGIDLMRDYITRNPTVREAYSQLGKLYLLNDQPDAANQAFGQSLSIGMLNNYATSFKRLNKLSEAESIYKLALKMNPKDSEVLFNLGNLYNATNKPELARDNYMQALQIRPSFAEAHYNLGLVYAKLGDRQQAVSHLQKYLQLSPNAGNAATIRTYIEKLKV